MAKKQPTSWKVDIARAWRDPAFPDTLYKPGSDITVDAATLGRMKDEADLVTSVVPVA